MVATDGIWNVSLGPRTDHAEIERLVIASNEEGTFVSTYSSWSLSGATLETGAKRHVES